MVSEENWKTIVLIHSANLPLKLIPRLLIKVIKTARDPRVQNVRMM